MQALQEILGCINRIDEFTGNPKLFAAYQKNILVQNAVERNLEIIGEAVKRLSEINPELNISDSRKIINTRNKISHGYDEIDNEQIWGIIINSLPQLKVEITNLLNQHR